MQPVLLKYRIPECNRDLMRMTKTLACKQGPPGYALVVQPHLVIFEVLSLVVEAAGSFLVLVAPS